MVRKIMRFARVSSMISWLRANNAAFAKWYQSRLLRRALLHGKPWVLVNSMGKVGSSSVHKTLSTHLDTYKSFHLHWLNFNNLTMDEKFIKTFYQKGRMDNSKMGILPDYILNGYYISKNLDKIAERSRIKLITMTRDPVARNISAFFENLPYFFGYKISDNLQVKTPGQIATELCKIFKDDFIGQNKIGFIDGDPLTWFDEEIKEVIGVNVYSTPFHREKGYTIFQNKKADLLVMRLEDLDNIFPEAISEFLSISPTKLESTNRGGKKPYAEVYSIFKEKIELPDEYIEELYTSKYAKHFYSDDEITKFRNKWQKN